MQKKQSMAEALEKNKRLRQQITCPTAAESEKTGDTERTNLKVVAAARDTEDAKQVQELHPGETNGQLHVAPQWVRHTVGLRPLTTLDLRDAADAQKQKKRRGLLQPGEPANEQEIADMGINWALEQIGFRRSNQG
ncbi:hypothetical protein OAS39_08300 [Pirellulales bacterium]|nr:hypothetical protein [Pirellulales bacterium]